MWLAGRRGRRARPDLPARRGRTRPNGIVFEDVILVPNLPHRMSGTSLVIAPVGTIDTTNSHDVEDRISALCSQNPHDEVVLDCTNLSFISSSGLRIVLRLAKRDGAVRIVNVSSEVYDILEMTGFTELFEVSKAFRHISVDGCPVIGEGANGIVYRIDPDTICKVYRNSDALPEIKRERELSRAAFVAGIPTAIPYDVVRVGEGYGSVFELLDADSMADLLINGTYSIEKVAHQCASLLLQMARTEVDPNVMPPVREEACSWVEALETIISAEKFGRLRELFSAVPDIPNMVHGDFHIKNILVQDGEPLLIDMDTLSHGDPVFDLAGTYNAYVGFGAADPNETLRFLGMPYETANHLWDLIIHEYLQGASDEEFDAALDKIRLVSSVRLLSRAVRHKGIGSPSVERALEVYGTIIDDVLPRVESIAL